MTDVPTLFDLTPGKVVAGRYRVVRSHRQGGLSAAFEVIDLESDEPCELQLFPGALFETRQQASEFAASWEPWMRVDSPSVLRVRRIVHAGETTLLLVTDFPFGISLRQRLKARSRMQPAEVRAVGRQLLEGLDAIHTHGLVHGDIKPHTIHIDEDGDDPRVVLVDGGVTPGLWTAKQLGQHTALIGTPYYAPIEQFGGDSPDVQSDIYNVATVLFELATGVLPWKGSSFLEVFQAKLDKRPPSMRERAPGVDIPPDLEQAVVQGLLADRKERHPTARAFLRCLGA